MTTETSPGAPAPAKRTRKSSTAPRPNAAPAKVPKVQESRGEEIVHELFRLAHVDLRSSDHGTRLARELGQLLHKGVSRA